MRTRVYFSGDCEKVVFWWFHKNQGYHRFLHFLLILGENPNHQAKNVRFLVITRKFVITRFQITRKNPGSHEITRFLLDITQIMVMLHYLVITRIMESADIRQNWWFEPGDYIIWWFEPGDYIIWWFGPGDYIIWWSETWWLHYLVIWAWWLHYLVIWRLVGDHQDSHFKSPGVKSPHFWLSPLQILSPPPKSPDNLVTRFKSPGKHRHQHGLKLPGQITTNWNHH